MTDPATLTTALRDERVLACGPGRVVVLASEPWRMSRRTRIVLSVVAVAALPPSAALLARVVLPGSPLLPALGIGLAAGLLGAGAALVDSRLVAVAGGPGVVVEHRRILGRTRRRSVLVAFDELTGHDVQAAVDYESAPAPWPVYVLRLHAGSRRLPVWWSAAPDVADAVGRCILDVARGSARR